MRREKIISLTIKEFLLFSFDMKRALAEALFEKT